ncbi:MAG: tol-pal system protein YbgF [Candidatus Rokubacteria bacterium]|nr:tol-pal system protein YbgF [Candidatus Rokubacteria bacterium]MBI3825457.1 tol-pal system protein YbgF [Candidatus Rokubacteria bacterium]
MRVLVPVLVALTLLTTGCATRAGVRAMRADLDAVRKDLAAVREGHELNTKETARNIADLRAMETRAREITDALTGMSRDMARLSARLDDAENGVRATRAALEQQRVAAPPPPAPAPERPVREALRPNGADAAYGSALAFFRAREYGQAVLDFTDFIARFPRHPLASSAQFWIGEAYYVQRDYRQAIAELQKTAEVQTAPKAADALLKIGMSYAALRDTASAQQAWRRLVRDYPDTEAAVRARALLRGRASTAKGA